VTLVQVLDGLRAEGYGGSFLVDDAGMVSCCDCGSTVEPRAVELDGLRRLEGASDPSDMAAVLAVRCGRCGMRGSIVVRYGPEAGPGDSALLLGVGTERGSALDRAEVASALEPAAASPCGTDRHSTSSPRRPQRWHQRAAWLRSIGDRLDAAAHLDRVVARGQRAVHRVLPPGRSRDALKGTWLGHPLHPSLTHLPIGFWTSALVLDLVGGRRARSAADALVAMGVLSAAPTILTGLVDWSDLDDARRRSGAVHAAANITATGLFARSFLRRRAGHRAAGVALGVVGAAATAFGGFLGGHLVFGTAREGGGPGEGPASQ
jgi:uncharacterized membrane protein